MHIEIWSLGREHEPFIEEGIRHYFRKAKPWITTELVLLRATGKNTATDIHHIKQQEEALVLKRLQPHHHLILLDERGKLLDSPGWAQQFQQCMNQSVKTLVLLIGGAYGVSDNIRKQAKQIWSLSHLVFPHQLVRLILAEQIYRAYSILNHSPYHHE